MPRDDNRNSHVRYPAGSPASWRRNDEITGVLVTCVATGCANGPAFREQKKFTLDELPEQPWYRLGKRFVCRLCGTRGAVSIAPRWNPDVGRPSH
jgi:hypothetical protein